MSTSLVFDILARDRASTTFDKTGRAASRASGDVDRSSRSLRLWGRAAGFLAGGGALLLGGALVSVTKNAVADAAAQRRLSIALKNTTGATDEVVAANEAWIAVQGKALGVMDDELRPAVQRLAQATGDVSKAQELAALAMDISAGSGKSLETVTQALVRAQNGSLTSLSRLGLKTKDAEGNTLTLDAALKGLGATFAGQATARAAEAEGQYARLNVIFDETKESVGARLLPTLISMGGWILGTGIPAAEGMGRQFGKVSKFAKDNATALTVLGAVIIALTTVTKIHAAVMTVSAAFHHSV